MNESYHHAISNRLFLTLSSDELFFAVTDKDLHVQASGAVVVTDLDMLREALDTNTFLNQIFAKVYLVFAGNDFVIAPPILSDNEQKRKVFQASHRLHQNLKILEGSIAPDITVIYSANRSILDTVKEKYPSLVYGHEIESFYKHALQVVPGTSEEYSIVVHQQHENCLLLIRKGKHLLLLNRYDAKNSEDLFYFTMLAIEQLELDIEKSHLFWLDSNPISFDEAKILFENYIRDITLISTDHNLHPTLYMATQCE